MSIPKLRVGLAGLDHWYAALAFADAATASERIELVAVADDNEERATGVAQRYGVRSAEGPEALATDDSIDAVLSFVRNSRNPDVCVAAAEAGKHIISVKPLARTSAEAGRIAAAVRSSGVIFIPGETLFRFAGWYRFVKKAIDEGQLGIPLNAYFWVWCGLPQSWSDSDDPGWFVDPEQATGGAWIDHGIYEIDVLRSLWGREPASVRGTVANLKYHNLALEDHGTANVLFHGGATATLESSWAAPPGIPFELGLQLFGTEGAAAMDSRSERVAVLSSGSGEWTQGEFDGMGIEARCLDHFAMAIAGEEPVLTSIDDALANLDAALAFYDEAKQRGQVIA